MEKERARELKELTYNIRELKSLVLHEKGGSKYSPDFACEKTDKGVWIVYPWDQM